MPGFFDTTGKYARFSLYFSLRTAQGKRFVRTSGASGFRVWLSRIASRKMAVWEIGLGNQKLYFFPDRILIYQGSEVGAVQYKNFSVDLQHAGFIETDGVPSDSEVIGKTWQYVNKKGGPDGRFAHNPQIPIVRFGELTMRSSSGMNFVLQCSNPARAAEFKCGLEAFVAPFVAKS